MINQADSILISKVFMVAKYTNRLAIYVAIVSVMQLGLSGSASVASPIVSANQDGDQSADASVESAKTANRNGLLIKVPLPVDSRGAAKIRLVLKQIVEKAPQVVRPEERQVVVLEFDTSQGKSGRGSELEACQSLARYLASPEMNRVETVAYIPSRPSGDGSGGQLMGHAVLIAVAANQIAMDTGAQIGKAGIDEENIDPLVRAVYQGVAEQRLTLPVPIVMAMLDEDEQLFRVQTDDGVVYVNSDALTKLEESGKALNTNTISQQGEMALLTSQELEEFRLLRHQVASRSELEREFNLAPHSLDRNPAIEGAWRAVRVNLPPFIDGRTTQWITRSLNYQFSGTKPPNLVIFNMAGTDGDIDACLSLARYIAEMNSDEVQTVAFVSQNVRGPVAIAALANDQLIMSSDARLGGHIDIPEEVAFDEATLADLEPMVKAIARDKQLDWSLMMAMIDPGLAVNRYRHNKSGQVRLLSEEELLGLDSSKDWDPLGPVDVEEGITAKEAEKINVARTIVEDFDQLRTFYQLEEMPQTLQPSATDRWVERAAAVLATPMASLLLLFGAMFFLSTELSAPGLGVPGFLSAVCFLLFFWSQYLGGNADWLEIMLFLAGIVFIGMEIFLIPGFGVFGIGGLLMVVVSLVLASQSFVLPSTSEELARLPNSLLPLVGAGTGFFVAMFALRKVLPNSPYFNRMMLKPRGRRMETGLESDRDPEAIVDWSFLQGKTGETITRLFPAGKARIDGKVYDVITDGRMLDKGQPIEVVEAIGNRVVVKPREVD